MSQSASFTCPSCSRAWTENYCPVCASTIDRSRNQPPPIARPLSPANATLKAQAPPIERRPAPNAIAVKLAALSPMKQRIVGALIFLCIGLGALALGYIEPIHWAKMHPGQTVTISTQMLIVGSICTTMAIGIAAGAGNKKAIAIALACVGLVIGIFLRVELVSTLTTIAHAH
jgi:hypothetical protein